MGEDTGQIKKPVKAQKRELRMKKAVIIGAGPAGITAACELFKQSKEYEVLVLEESQ